MYGLETIRAMNRSAAEKATDEGLQPFVLDCPSLFDEMPPFPFPHLGDLCEEVDDRKERIDTLFVDTSGFGADNEPALSINQFVAKLKHLLDEHSEISVAIESAGQFQAYIAIWK